MSIDPIAALQSGGDIRLIESQADVDLTGRLIESFPGQRFDDLQSPMLPNVSALGAVDCFLVVLKNAYVLVAPGCDGVVVTAEGRPIAETMHFSDRASLERELALLHSAIDVEEPLFVSVDTPWFNYFHWMCFGVGKSLIAEPHLDPSFVMAFPDYDAHAGTPFFPRFRNDVWTGGQEIIVSGRPRRSLSPNRYRATSIAFLATRPTDPTAVTHLRTFYPGFSRAGARVRDGSSRRALIVRDALPRVQPQLSERLTRLAEQYSFEITRLETMSFQQQIELFANASAIVAPHGAGLANILFSSPDLKILELNSDLDNGSGLRPWFYILASGQGQAYRYLNVSDEATADRHLESAFEQIAAAALKA